MNYVILTCIYFGVEKYCPFRRFILLLEASVDILHALYPEQLFERTCCVCAREPEFAKCIFRGFPGRIIFSISLHRSCRAVLRPGRMQQAAAQAQQQ